MSVDKVPRVGPRYLMVHLGKNRRQRRAELYKKGNLVWVGGRPTGKSKEVPPQDGSEGTGRTPEGDA